MKNSVGRVVHYVAEDGKAHLAAIVTAEEQGTARVTGLAILRRTAIEFQPTVAYADPYDVNGYSTAGTWHWPERDE